MLLPNICIDQGVLFPNICIGVLLFPNICLYQDGVLSSFDNCLPNIYLMWRVVALYEGLVEWSHVDGMSAILANGALPATTMMGGAIWPRCEDVKGRKYCLSWGPLPLFCISSDIPQPTSFFRRQAGFDWNWWISCQWIFLCQLFSCYILCWSICERTNQECWYQLQIISWRQHLIKSGLQKGIDWSGVKFNAIDWDTEMQVVTSDVTNL